VTTIDSFAFVSEAIFALNDSHDERLLVEDEGAAVGVVTRRAVFAALAEGRDPRTLRVFEIMEPVDAGCGTLPRPSS
jgi:CBS domain-containing protein